MQRKRLAPASIKAESSRYRVAALLSAAGDEDLRASIAELGQIDPVTVHEVADGEYHLVDGFARCACLAMEGAAFVDANVVAAEASPESLMRYYFLAHQPRILESAAQRVRFLSLARRCGVGDETLVQHFLPMVGFEAHPRLLRRCEAVAALPEEVLQFCHEKRFSLKQCLHLTRHPAELLSWLFDWRDHLALTASIIEELAGHIGDHLRGSGTSMAEFRQRPELVELFAARMSPQERTRRLRDTVRRWRFPVLTQVQSEMESIRNAMNLPQPMELRWDPTLEQHAVELRILVRSDEQWPEIAEAIGRPETRRGVRELLEHL